MAVYVPPSKPADRARVASRIRAVADRLDRAAVRARGGHLAGGEPRVARLIVAAMHARHLAALIEHGRLFDSLDIPPERTTALPVHLVPGTSFGGSPAGSVADLGDRRQVGW